MKKTFLLLLAATLFLSYGCSTVSIDTVKVQTEEKGFTIGRILHLPITAYRSIIRGFKAEDKKDDTLID